MPLYEFKCVSCGRIEEVLLLKQEEIKKVAEKKTLDGPYGCSNCGSTLEKIMSVPGKGKVK